MAFFTCGLSHLRPIRRFAAKTVFSAFVTAWRFAMWPTKRFPASVTASSIRRRHDPGDAHPLLWRV